MEDNALNREIAVEMLESTGAVVESAFDGAEGAAICGGAGRIL